MPSHFELRIKVGVLCTHTNRDISAKASAWPLHYSPVRLMCNCENAGVQCVDRGVRGGLLRAEFNVTAELPNEAGRRQVELQLSHLTSDLSCRPGR